MDIGKHLPAGSTPNMLSQGVSSRPISDVACSAEADVSAKPGLLLITIQYLTINVRGRQPSGVIVPRDGTA